MGPEKFTATDLYLSQNPLVKFVKIRSILNAENYSGLIQIIDISYA
jgi:hypothetical protein